LIKLQGRKKGKRVGRGYGSGKGGHTTGRGTKGQKARKGRKPWPGFEGGQVPLYKRLPKIGGFRNHKSKDIVGINILDLEVFKENTELTPQKLFEKGIIKRIPRDGVKLLGNDDVKKAFILKGFLYSRQALAKLKKAGSKISEINDKNL